MREMKNLQRHWQEFLIFALIGCATPLLLPIKAIGEFIRSTLLNLPLEVYLGGFIIGIAALLFFTRRMSLWWSRYANTKRLPSPPLIILDLVLTAALFAFLSLKVAFGISLIDSFRAIGTPRLEYLLSFILLFGLWCSTTLIFSSHIASLNTSQNRSRPSQGDYFDEPIIRADQDLLSRTDFVERVAAQIKTLPFANSFVYALNASWGEGKTSVLNLLRSKIGEDPSFIIIGFNPWYLSSPDALTKSFYSTMQQTVSSRYLAYGLHGLIKRYRTILTEGLRQVGFLGEGVQENPESVKQELERWLNKTGCRLLVIIDDIDRLRPEEVLATFKLTTLTANVDNAVFILAFDQEVITTCLEQLKIDSSYLGKAIQQSIPLPPAEQDDIDRFLLMSDAPGQGNHRSAIDNLLDELAISPETRLEFDKQIVEAYTTKLKRLFKTLRDCKRFLNGLRGTLPSVKDEINLYDFFLLETLRMFSPTLYKDIWANYFYYLPRWSHELILIEPTRFLDEDKKVEAVRLHVGNQLERHEQKDVIQYILEELFPESVGKAFSPMNGGTSDKNARAERRLTHPECFPKYFLYRLPKNDLPDALIFGLIDQCNKQDEVTAEETFREALLYQHRNGRFLTLVARLASFSGRVNPNRIRAITKAMSSIADKLVSTHDHFWESELSRAELYVVHLLEERGEDVDCDMILGELIITTPSPLFLVLVVHSITSDGRAYYRLRGRVDKDKLRDIAVSRLETYYITGKRDIFAELPGKGWVSVLSQWGKNWEGDSSSTKAMVTRYIVSLFQQNPEYLGVFLENLVETNFPSGEGSHFNLAFLKRFTEHKTIAQSLQQFGDSPFKTERQREAVKLFEASLGAESDEADAASTESS